MQFQDYIQYAMCVRNYVRENESRKTFTVGRHRHSFFRNFWFFFLSSFSCSFLTIILFQSRNQLVERQSSSVLNMFINNNTVDEERKWWNCIVDLFDINQLWRYLEVISLMKINRLPTTTSNQQHLFCFTTFQTIIFFRESVDNPHVFPSRTSNHPNVCMQWSSCSWASSIYKSKSICIMRGNILQYRRN